MRYFAPIFALLLIGAAAAPGHALAQPSRARAGVRAGQVRPLDQILNGIRRERPGNLADVQGPNIGPEGEPRYRLKWITPDGRVLWLDTNARTGRVLGVQGDDRGGPSGLGPVPPPNLAPPNLPPGNFPPGNFPPGNFQRPGPPPPPMRPGPNRFSRGWFRFGR
jgi:hypothetical protein